jgi:uncharacterized protein (DUF1810 family)
VPSNPASDPYDLERFVKAQARVFDQVCAELRAGEKRSHWMWFVFPQVKGLGSSEMARRYAISSLDEARAYLQHPLLGSRLEECTRLVNAVQGRTLEQIFHQPDSMKFHSSMTLFAHAASDRMIFREALAKYCNGALDPKTIDQLK